MFNRALANSLIDELSEQQRGTVATLVLARLRGMVLRNLGEEVSSYSTRQVIEDAYSYCEAQVAGQARGNSVALRQRFEELLGPDEFPFEDPEGIEPWFIDLVSTADYVVRVWEVPSASDDACFNVLLSSYSIAGNLEDDPDLPSGPLLGQLEFDRQIDDMRAIQSRGTSVSELFESSARLGEMYTTRFIAYISHQRNSPQ